MSNNITRPIQPWKISAAVSLVLAIAIGATLFEASRAADTAVVTTSCSGFSADARNLLAMGTTRTLSGAFAPGDHVHLAVDFKGTGYSGKLNGVLGTARADVTGSGWFESNATSTETTEAKPRISITDVSFAAAASISGNSISAKPPSPEYKNSTISGEAHGTITGLARLDVDIDVAAAGDGAITIDQAGSVPLLIAPRILSATCITAKNAQPSPSADASSSGSARGLSAPLG
jgi:hypothetical protein